MKTTGSDSLLVLVMAAGTAVWVALGGYGLVALAAQAAISGATELVIAIGRSFLTLGP